MSQSLAQIYVHLVFSTKDRLALITPEIQDELFPYLGGMLNNHDCQSLGVGGTTDHVHLLFDLGKAHNIQALVGELKSSSSHWVKERFPQARLFYWQAGYAAFSISASHVDATRAYVANQQAHHKRVGFRQELVRLLKKNRVEYDEAHLWD